MPYVKVTPIEPKFRVVLPSRFKIRERGKIAWLKDRVKSPLPVMEVDEEDLLRFLGINAPIVAIHISKVKRKLGITFHPQYLWPKCPSCQTPFFQKHKRQTTCSRNCTRRERYAETRATA